MYRRILLSILVLIAFSRVGFAQVIIQEDTVECSIYFHQGKSYFDPVYKDNGKRLKAFVNDVYFRSDDPSMSIKKIVVNSGASPEGPQALNKRLSKERADAIIKYLKRSTDIDDSMLIVHSPGVDWEGLILLVKASDDIPDKEAVLQMMTSEEFGDDDIARRKSIENLNGGTSYRWMYRNLFPSVRHSRASIAYVSRFKKELILPEGPVIAYSPVFTAPDNASILIPEPPPAPVITVEPADTSKPVLFALKTNLLYDAVTALNFAIEIPVGKRFSVLYEHHCPWWLSKDNKYCMQFLSYGGELRWWVAPRPKKNPDQEKVRNRLMGHFLGLYGWTGKSDIQIDNRLGCYQFEFCSAGLTYGYAMPIGKHLNMEFSISAGYAQVPYQHYIPTEDWQILIKDNNKAGTLHYIGPTKAEISLVIPICAKNKGGKDR